MYTNFVNLGIVKRNSDGVVVAPTSDINSVDYLGWISWCESGNEPLIDTTQPSVSQITTVPESVSPRQIRLALSRLGLRQLVEDAVAQMPIDYQDTWEYALEIRRDDPMIEAFGQQYSVDLDALFILAESL